MNYWYLILLDLQIYLLIYLFMRTGVQESRLPIGAICGASSSAPLLQVYDYMSQPPLYLGHDGFRSAIN